jgi:hypothetical protein
VKPARALRAAYVRSGIRNVLPTALKTTLRGRWVRAARRAGYPISSPKLPRPELARGRRPPQLTHVLLASDLNPRYIQCWELVRRAWQDIVGVEPVLVLVADEAEAPAELLDDPQVRLFAPLQDVHTAFQAQCIRLLYPALVETRGMVVIADIELVPLDPRYFHGPLAGLDERFFVAYRDVLHDRSMIAMSYNAARPETWGELFGVRTADDVRLRLAEWASGISYTAQRGGPGWYTDQQVLYARALPWAERTGRLWMLDDAYTGFRRLDRLEANGQDVITPRRRRELLARRYTDYDGAVPHALHRELNEHVLSLALESLGRVPAGSRSATAAARSA